MKRARVVGAWGISLVVGAGLLWACSSSTAENGNPGGSTQDATTGGDTGSLSGDDSGSTNKDSGTIPKKDGGGDGGGTGVCGSSATVGDCYTCCDTVASDGGVSDFFQFQGQCLCGTKHCDTAATCKNTFCADPGVADAGVKCNACQDKFLNDDAGEAGCEGPVIDECATFPNCAAGLECVVEANCDSLPN
jgi:hypothetical protein